MSSALKHVTIVRVKGARRADDVDRAATEEPLEVRLHGTSFAVIMRTPGADRELVAGFLLAEQVLKHPDDLGTIEHCRDPRVGNGGSGRAAGSSGAGVGDDGPARSDAAPAENVINVTLTGTSREGLEGLLAARRQTVTNSSCGMCGRLTIESLRADAPPLRISHHVAPATIARLPDRLRAAQALFDATGGLHAAGLFAPDDALVATAEDVGRHNAVDKVIGRMLMRDALPLTGHLLFVSGRTSFEIVQKAFLAGIPLVASVSAPSSLAIELATDAGLTLVGFVRGDGFNIYAHPERVGD